MSNILRSKTYNSMILMGVSQIWYKYCKHMYINGKLRPVETIPRMGGGEIKENGGGMNSSMIYLIYIIMI
jgi:hypothetical protein